MAKTTTKDIEEEDIVDVSDMEPGDHEMEDKKITTSKKELRTLLKDIQLEDRLKYVVECKGKEELEKIIELAQEKINDIENGKDSDTKDKEVATPKY